MIHRNPLTTLFCASIITKIVVALTTLFFARSFFDVWGYSVYLNTVVLPFLQHGSIPYLNYAWEYPPLMLVPTALATVPMLLLNNPNAFYWSFAILMAICDCVTIYCVYMITLKIGNARSAFASGLLVATAFSAAYHVITCYDEFAVCLMMLGLMFAICGHGSAKSYTALVCGYFAKLFPAAVIPFVFLYNKPRDPFTFAKVAVPLTAIFAVPLILVNAGSVFLDSTESAKGVFGSTLDYNIYAWTGISQSAIVIAMCAILVIVMAVLIWVAYKSELTPRQLLSLCLIALVALIVCVPHHSPQYMIWFVPILAILAAGNLYAVLLFYLFQGIEFIKFPILFYRNWTNAGYLPQNWLATAVFFSLEFIVLFYLVWITAKPMELIKKCRL